MSVEVRVADGVGTIEVEDFAPLSAGDVAFAVTVRDAVVDLADDDGVKAILLRSRGDFAPAVAPAPPDPVAAFTTWTRDVAGAAGLYQAIAFAKKVTITEVAGACLGAGGLLVLASDLTIAAEDARFGAPLPAHPETNVVLAALTVRLNRAKAWLLRGSAIDAAMAEAYGLVNDVVARAELAGAAAAAAARVTAIPLDGVVMSKMLLQPVLDASGVGREFDMAAFYAAGETVLGVEREGAGRG